MKSLDLFLEEGEENGQIDLDKLRSYSRSEGGFGNSHLRRKIWPLLLGVSRYGHEEEEKHSGGVKRLIDITHGDFSQVHLDVDRSLWSRQIEKKWDHEKLMQVRSKLTDVILATLSQNRSIHYYQGFHDVVSVLILVMMEDETEGGDSLQSSEHFLYRMTSALTETYFEDMAREDFTTITKTMAFILHIIHLHDKELYNFLKEAQIPPYFAMSWVITWFSHDLKSLGLKGVARIFDVCLCSPPYYCLYLCAAYLLANKDKILGVECDFAMVHNALSNGTHSWGMQIEEVIKLTDSLLSHSSSNGIPHQRQYQSLVSSDAQLSRLQWRGLVAMFDCYALHDPASSFNRKFAPADWMVIASCSHLHGGRKGGEVAAVRKRSGRALTKWLQHSVASLAISLLEAAEFLLCIEDDGPIGFSYKDDIPLLTRVWSWTVHYPSQVQSRIFLLSGGKTMFLVAFGFGVAAWISNKM